MKKPKNNLEENEINLSEDYKKLKRKFVKNEKNLKNAELVLEFIKKKFEK